MISSLRSALGIFVVVDKAKSSFIAEPMIPLVYKWFIHFVEKKQAPFKAPAYISFRNIVSAGSDPPGNSLNSVVR